MIAPYEDGTLLSEGQGPFAPEQLLSDAYSRRFVGTPGDGKSKYLIVTDYYAVVSIGEWDEGGDMPQVLNCTEFLWTNSLDEPGSFEVDSEYTYEDGDVYDTLIEAEAAARDDLERYGLDTWLPMFEVAP